MPTAGSVRPRRPRIIAAVVLILAVGAAPGLAACEYQYDDGRPTGPATAAATYTDAALPQDPALSRPVTGPELKRWVDEVLPEGQGQAFHLGYGMLDAGAVRNETTTQLPSGTYSVALVCRSSRRVSFTIRDKESVLVDLSLRCTSSRVNVVQLGADTVLRVRIEALAAANFAYRVTRI